MENKKRIGVIFGGKGSEREVSLSSGRNVYNNLDRARFEVKAIYWDKEFKFWEIPEVLVIRNTCKEIEERLDKFGSRISYEELPEKIDIAFLTTHGKYGDDGCLQGLLEFLKLPYTGSGVLSAALCLDKIAHITLLQNIEGVNTPKFISFNARTYNIDNLSNEITSAFGFPCVIKPSREGSTMGVVKVSDRSGLEKAIQKAREYDNYLMAEPFLSGREFSCMVIGNEEPKALLPTETKYEGEIFSYDHKYLPGASQKITPMAVSQEIISEIQKQCVLAYKALQMRDYARIDGFVLKDDTVMITDPNSAASTGLGPSSWTFHQAAKEGMLPAKLLSYFVDLVIERI